MEIKAIEIGKLTIPLIRPFITSVRRTNHVEDVTVLIKTDRGLIGYGSAAATPAITGETVDSIISAIKNSIAPRLLRKSITGFNNLLHDVQNSLKGNTSAKAAIDVALHDLFAQKCQMPLYQFLGSAKATLNTSVTISVKDPESMAREAQEYVASGIQTIKIKVGLNAAEDLLRIQTVRNFIGPQANIWIDANQGWGAKEALEIIHKIERENLKIQIIEQPVHQSDLTGLKFIREQVESLIIADESCFSIQNALHIAAQQIADGVNIKLMKCGGIANAQAIYSIAKSANLQCMTGCMLESPIGVAAMSSFAVGKNSLLGADLDPMVLIKNNPLKGGAQWINNQIVLAEKPGLGIEGFTSGYTKICEIE